MCFGLLWRSLLCFGLLGRPLLRLRLLGRPLLRLGVCPWRPGLVGQTLELAALLALLPLNVCEDVSEVLYRRFDAPLIHVGRRLGLPSGRARAALGHARAALNGHGEWNSTCGLPCGSSRGWYAHVPVTGRGRPWLPLSHGNVARTWGDRRFRGVLLWGCGRAWEVDGFGKVAGLAAHGEQARVRLCWRQSLTLHSGFIGCGHVFSTRARAQCR